jgi:hypothetical protein
MFYPDNALRAGRLQQLVDSMADMQTDIKESATTMDTTNTAIQPAIDAMLKAKGLATVDDLINQSMDLLTPDQRKVYENMIAQAKATGNIFDWTYFACGLLMVPEGFVLTGKMVMAIGRFGSKIGVVQKIAKVFSSGDTSGGDAAANEAENTEQEANNAESDLNEIGEGGDAAEDLAEAVSIMSRVMTFLKVLGGIGFVCTLVVGIVEAIEGAEQKTQLINAIQTCQPSRLCIKFYKNEMDNIMQQLALLQAYLPVAYGPSANPVIANYLATTIINNIVALDAAIDWTQMETDLETQDKTSGNFYGDDDLATATVISMAQGLVAPPPPVSGTSSTNATANAAVKTAAVKAAANVAQVAHNVAAAAAAAVAHK